MEIKKLVDEYNFKMLTNTDDSVKIKGVYSCDLLSWVMAKGQEGYAWITVQSHKNILAVASLIEFSCILLPEGVNISEDVIEKANDEGISILETDMNPYEIYEIFIKEGIEEK